MIFLSKKLSIFFIIIGTVFLVAQKETFSAAVILDSIGAVSSGRGGTNIAHWDNGQLIHDNPASLVNMPAGKRLDIELHFIYPEIKYEDPQDSDYVKHTVFTIPSLSFSYKRHKDSKFAFGFGVYTPAGFGTEYHLKHSVNRRFSLSDISFGNQLYKSGASLVKILFATSYRINQKLTIGLSVGPSFQKAGFESPSTFQTGRLAGLSVLANLTAKDNFGFSYTGGIQFKVSEKTMIGMSFISESKATLKGDTDIFIPGKVPFSGFFFNRKAEYDVKSNFEWPRYVGIGISHLAGKSHRFSVDIVWFNWSSAFDQLDLELTDGDNALFNRVIGETVNDELPLDWEDAFVYRFGYEYFYQGDEKDVFRFGYIFNENPIPGDTLTALIPGTLKHNFTFGYSHKWERLKFNVASQFSIGDTEFVGNSDIVGGDYDNSAIHTKVYGFLLGLEYEF